MHRLILSLSRRQKARIFLAIDLALIPAALLFTFAVQSLPEPALRMLALYLPVLPPVLPIAAASLIWLGLPQIPLKAYERRAVGLTAVHAVLVALAIAALSPFVAPALPAGTHVMFAISYFLMLVAGRAVLYQIVIAIYDKAGPRCRVLIYGAGNTGTQLAHALKAHDSIDPVAFVDDNGSLQGMTVAGLPVHAPARIAELVAEKDIRRVLLAMPSAPRPRQAQIARRLQKMGLEVQALPSFAQLIGEEALLDKLAPVAPHAFLGRASRADGLGRAAASYAGRVVMVSGAGGSIGAELCRQVLACRPSRLVLFEIAEPALYAIDQELRHLADEAGVGIVPVLGSVADAGQVRRVLAGQGVEVVLHAAAYKHVPLVEGNPLPGLANNVFGTQVLAREAAEAGVERFILISTDKAVRPTNVMGASKRMAELVVQDLATRSRGTIFAMVRFGNVLGSSGSVVPLFQDQISRGGPVTVTDPGMKRYFMTIGEAVQLVLKAGAEARGGEVFVLDMGEPVPIMRLARQVIESAGYTVRDAANPDGDIEIEIIGPRPGEKLEEELTLSGDLVGTRYPKIFCARETGLSEIEVAAMLRGLGEAVESGDEEAARAVVRRWVEGYRPQAARSSGER